MTEDMVTGVPASVPPEEVLKWMLFWLKMHNTSITRWTHLLATQPLEATHPQTVELMVKHAQQMTELQEQVSDYLRRREVERDDQP
ncbi:MAG TPA: hypothetical protein VMT34_17995 [Aggregatilineales bacterium]|nr:hypothetical protein [Aggregatilineales bacterium]